MADNETAIHLSETNLVTGVVPAFLLHGSSLLLGLSRSCGLAILLQLLWLLQLLALLQVPPLLALQLTELLLLPRHPVLRLLRLLLLLRLVVPCRLRMLGSAALQRLLRSPEQVILSLRQAALHNTLLKLRSTSNPPLAAVNV